MVAERAPDIAALRQRNGGVTVETKVEDLLASIRKAIDDEDGTSIPVHISIEEKGTITRGPIREMRVNFDNTPAIAAPVRQDIETLRTRIARKNAETGFSAPPMPTFRAAPEAARPAGFSNIMAGGRAEIQPPVLQAAAPPQPEPEPEPEYIRRTQPAAVHHEDFVDLDAESDSPPPYEDTYAAEPEPVPQHNPFAPPLMHFTAPPQQAQSQPYTPQTALVSQHAEHNARRAFDDLSSAILSRATSERDIEDITRDMLRNYLSRWLDDNLPGLVEKLVREEIQRVARHGN
jgi:uncharacterized protein